MINALLAAAVAAGWSQTVRVAPVRIQLSPTASVFAARPLPASALSPGLGRAPAVALPGLKSILATPSGWQVHPAPGTESPDSPAPRPASEGLEQAAEFLPAPDAAPAPEDQAKEAAGRVFDHRNKGPLPVNAAPESVPGLPLTDSVLPRYLSVADPGDALWVSLVLEEASRSAAARRVLARVEAMAVKRGRPVTVVVQRITNLGTYDFDTEVVTLSLVHRKLPLIEVAPTLVHELLHVVQKSEGVPSDALELELDAYLTDWRVMTELGIPIRPRSFEGKGLEQFKKSFPDFVRWLGKEYKGNIPLIGSNLKAYLAQLENNAAKHSRSLKRKEKELLRREEVLRSMESIGHSADQREVYEADQITPLRRNIAGTKRTLAWIEHDSRTLRTPEGARRYRAFAAAVNRKARAFRRTLEGS